MVGLHKKPTSPVPRDVVFVVEDTAICGDFLEELKETYLIPILEYFNDGPITDQDFTELAYTMYGLIIIHTNDISPGELTDAFGPMTTATATLKALDKIEFTGGPVDAGKSHIAEGLATALQCFNGLTECRDGQSDTPAAKHIILICNSKPYDVPVKDSVTLKGSFRGMTAEQLAELMSEKEIHLSVMSPSRIPELINLFEKGGGRSATQKKNEKDPDHLILLNGIRLEEGPLSPNHVNVTVMPVSTSRSLSVPASFRTNPFRIPLASWIPPLRPLPPIQLLSVPRWMEESRRENENAVPAINGTINYNPQNPNSQQVGRTLHQTQSQRQMANGQGSHLAEFHNPTHIPEGLISQSLMTPDPQQHPSMMIPQQFNMMNQQGYMNMDQQRHSHELQSSQQFPTNEQFSLQQMDPQFQSQAQISQAISTHQMIQGPVLSPFMSAPKRVAMPTSMDHLGNQLPRKRSKMNHMSVASFGSERQLPGPSHAQVAPSTQTSPTNSAMLPTGTQPSILQQQLQGSLQPGTPAPLVTVPALPQQIMPTAGAQQQQTQSSPQPQTVNLVSNVQRGKKEVHSIWTGKLEWQEKQAGLPEQQPISHEILCRIHSFIDNGETQVKADGWPAKLIMQMVQKNIVANLGGCYLVRGAQNLVFQMHAGAEEQSLGRYMETGYVGCIHFVGAGEACTVKVIVMLYSAEKKIYIGFIPHDQDGILEKIRVSVQQRNEQQVSLQEQVLLGNPQQVGLVQPMGMVQEERQAEPIQADNRSANFIQSQPAGIATFQPANGLLEGNQAEIMHQTVLVQAVPTPIASLGQQLVPASRSQYPISSTFADPVGQPQHFQPGQNPNFQQDVSIPQPQSGFYNRLELERQQNLLTIQEIQQSLAVAQQRERQFQQREQRPSHDRRRRSEYEPSGPNFGLVQGGEQQQFQRAMPPIITPQRMDQAGMMRPSVLLANPGLRQLLEQPPGPSNYRMHHPGPSYFRMRTPGSFMQQLQHSSGPMSVPRLMPGGHGQANAHLHAGQISIPEQMPGGSGQPNNQQVQEVPQSKEISITDLLN